MVEHPAEEDNAKSRAVVYKKTPDTRPLLFQVGHGYVQSHGNCVPGWSIYPQHTGAGPRLGVGGWGSGFNLASFHTDSRREYANVSRIMK